MGCPSTKPCDSRVEFDSYDVDCWKRSLIVKSSITEDPRDADFMSASFFLPHHQNPVWHLSSFSRRPGLLWLASAKKIEDQFTMSRSDDLGILVEILLEISDD